MSSHFSPILDEIFSSDNHFFVSLSIEMSFGQMFQRIFSPLLDVISEVTVDF
jgi:hypothetical protein